MGRPVRAYDPGMAVSRADRRLERAARSWAGDRRTARELREHYAIERLLAMRLATAGPERRGALYSEVYDELFSAIPHHPQLRRRSSAERRSQVERELHFVGGLLRADLAFLELGSGDQALARRVAPLVAEVHAVDVATAIAGGEPAPENLHTHLTDGSRLSLRSGSIDLAYSNQLMEHLHPEDADVQLREIFRVLRSGGSYLCVTPNRLTGPWDVSRLFRQTPDGLHLREYSNRELAAALRAAGFTQIWAVVPGRSAARRVPLALLAWPEQLFAPLSPRVRRSVLRRPWCKPWNSVRLLAQKP
jgi:SAM-dependent methyltransferase